MASTAICDFYRLRMPQSGEISFKFEDLLLDVSTLDESRRTEHINGFPIRLQSLTQSENYKGCKIVEGEMIRIKMRGLPVVAGIDEGVETLDLEDDEGLGSQTAFMYHPATQVLVLHSVQTGVSIVSFLKYFEEMGSVVFEKISGEIKADPIINKDALVRYKKISEVKSFSFRIAGVDNEEFFKDIPHAVKEEIALLKKYGAPSIGLTITTGRVHSESLNPNASSSTIDALMKLSGRHKKNVHSLEISGKSAEDETIKIKNLFNDLIKEEIRLNEPNLRNIPYFVRRDALRTAWTNRKDEIYEIIKPKQSSSNEGES